MASHAGWGVVSRLRPAGCAVLMYHRVGQPDDPFPNLHATEFRKHMEWLAGHCRFMEVDDLRSSAAAPARMLLPVLVTFDDGYRGFYDHAYPILKRVGIPAVNFLPTSYIDRPRLAWWDLLHLAVKSSTRSWVPLPGPGDTRLPLTPEGKGRYLRHCKVRIKAARASESDELLRGIWETLDVDPAALQAPRQYMTWDEVRASSDVATFGGHTHTHPLLTKVDRSSAVTEIETCRERIAAETGRVPPVFAYPSGDFDRDVQMVAAECGFDTAFSTIEGLARPDGDWLAIKRVSAERRLASLAWGLTRTWLGPAPR